MKAVKVMRNMGKYSDGKERIPQSEVCGSNLLNIAYAHFVDEQRVAPESDVLYVQGKIEEIKIKKTMRHHTLKCVV